MAQSHPKYLILDDVRVAYQHQDDTIRLTSNDPDIPNGNFSLTLRQNTPTEQALRKLLKSRGYIKPLGLEVPHPLKQLITNAALKETPGRPRVLMTGQPGTGKTTNAVYAAHIANRLKMSTIVLTSSQKFDTPNAIIHDLDSLPAGFLDPFQFGIDTGTHIAQSYLSSSNVPVNPISTTEKLLIRESIEQVKLYNEKLSLHAILKYLDRKQEQGTYKEEDKRVLKNLINRITILLQRYPHLFQPFNDDKFPKDNKTHIYSIKGLKLLDEVRIFDQTLSQQRDDFILNILYKKLVHDYIEKFDANNPSLVILDCDLPLSTVFNITDKVSDISSTMFIHLRYDNDLNSANWSDVFYYSNAHQPSAGFKTDITHLRLGEFVWEDDDSNIHHIRADQTPVPDILN